MSYIRLNSKFYPLFLMAVIFSLPQIALASNNHLLTGTWSSVCAKGDDGKFLIETFIFKQNSAQYSVKSYEDADCKNLLSTLTTQRSFTLGDLTSQTENIRKLDYVFKSVSMEFSNDALISSANKLKYYGFDNWVLNKSKDVSGLRKTSTSDKEHARGDRFYTIVKIEKNNLFMGDYASGAGTSSKTRLSAVYKVPFVRLDQ